MTSTGVSVGWFDVGSLFPDTPLIVKGIRSMLRKPLAQNRSWPFAVSSVRSGGQGLGVAYAEIAGAVPLHIDETGPNDSDGRIFQFILDVENRPALLTVAPTDDSVPIMMGFAPPTKPQIFRTGGIEMKAGMAIHFDITQLYHGITSLPVPVDSIRTSQPPRAIIVQVSGYAADQIGDAVEHASRVIKADLR